MMMMMIIIIIIIIIYSYKTPNESKNWHLDRYTTQLIPDSEIPSQAFSPNREKHLC